MAIADAVNGAQFTRVSLSPIKGLRASGQKSRFRSGRRATGLPRSRIDGDTGAALSMNTVENEGSEALAKKRRAQTNTGADEVISISFLPHAFTTLFIIAASLLLGLMR